MAAQMIVIDEHNHKHIVNLQVHRSGIVGQKKSYLLTVNRRGSNIEISRIFQKGEFEKYSSGRADLKFKEEIDNRPLHPDQIKKGCLITLVDDAPMNYARDGSKAPISVKKVLKETASSSIKNKVIMLKSGELVDSDDVMKVYEDAA